MVWWIMLGGIILSCVAGDNFHPAIVLIRQMAEKLFKPFRIFLPPMGGLDFSPIFAFILERVYEIFFSHSKLV